MLQFLLLASILGTLLAQDAVARKAHSIQRTMPSLPLGLWKNLAEQDRLASAVDQEHRDPS